MTRPLSIECLYSRYQCSVQPTLRNVEHKERAASLGFCFFLCKVLFYTQWRFLDGGTGSVQTHSEFLKHVLVNTETGHTFMLKVDCRLWYTQEQDQRLVLSS